MVVRALVLAALLVTTVACGSAPASTPVSSPASATPVPTPAAKRPAIHYGALGDSITVGIGTSDPDTKNYAALAGIPARGRPGSCLVIVKRCLWRTFVATFVPDIAVLRRYAPVTTVIVEVGINDIITSGPDTVARMKRAYRAVRAEGREHGVTVVLTTLVPFGRTHSGRLSSAVTPARERRRAVINRWIRHHGPYLEFAHALAPGAILPPRYDAGDGVHPNDAGQAVLARVVEAYMKRKP